MRTILFTGFPGFLGARLLPRILAARPEARAVCLVQPKYASLARARVDALVAGDPSLAGRIELVPGDITRPGLGIEDAALPHELREVHHLAAVYDLEVSREVAMRVNVEGTRNVLDFAQSCARLERVHYVSTCYVSGRHPGVFRETDLDVGQRFNNHYEETKFLAEVEVQARMGTGLPVTIYRPAVIVGDSRTGATSKFDGPYCFVRLLLRQPRIAVMPVAGDPRRIRPNVVPVDFVTDAIAYLSARAGSVGKVYQLADPDPPTVAEMLEAMARAAGRRLVRVRVPRALLKGMLRAVPLLSRLTGTPPNVVDYFVHPTAYATDDARTDLAGSGIAVPPFRSYVDRLVAFVREHPEAGSGAMV